MSLKAGDRVRVFRDIEPGRVEEHVAEVLAVQGSWISLRFDGEIKARSFGIANGRQCGGKWRLIDGGMTSAQRALIRRLARAPEGAFVPVMNGEYFPAAAMERQGFVLRKEGTPRQACLTLLGREAAGVIRSEEDVPNSWQPMPRDEGW